MVILLGWVVGSQAGAVGRGGAGAVSGRPGVLLLMMMSSPGWGGVVGAN